MRLLFAAILLLLAHPAMAGHDDESMAIYNFMTSMPDFVARFQVTLQMADPNTPEKEFYLGAVTITAGPSGQACRLRVLLQNNFRRHAIDKMDLVLTSHSRDGLKIAVHDFTFRFVDPDDFESLETPVDWPCSDLSFVRPREVTTCRIGGQMVIDCLDIFPERIEVQWMDALRRPAD